LEDNIVSERRQIQQLKERLYSQTPNRLVGKVMAIKQRDFV